MDFRTAFKPSKEILIFEEEYGIILPKKKEVCPTCGGTGKHVNPNIDGHGLTREDFEQDPDFFDAYISGVYDVRCYECNGRNVVDTVDLETLKRTDRQTYEEWIKWLIDSEDYHYTCMMERRMGC